MKTVFVVDDDGLMLELLRRTLERAGYRAQAFDSAVKASEALESGQPDLVISDINMPEMDGFELVEVVARRDDGTPVIMITGEPTEDAERRAQKLGVRMMRKPVRDLSPLIEWVRESIGDGASELEKAHKEFLVDISHELRTPLTALKLAFDALGDEGSAPDRDRLVAIGRRSLDRLARHVDGQLRLLEHSLNGERAARRPVSLEEALGETSELAQSLNGSGDVRIVTDVKRLQAVIRHLTEADNREVNFSVDVGDTVTLRFENAKFSDQNGLMDSSAGEGPTAPLWNPSARGSDSFEQRACDRIIEAAGGRLVVEADEVRIELPIADVDSPAVTT